MDLHDRIPDADVYIIENSNWSNIANSKVSVSLQMQRSQLVTAILTVFNIQKLNSTGKLWSTSYVCVFVMFTNEFVLKTVVLNSKLILNELPSMSFSTI